MQRIAVFGELDILLLTTQQPEQEAGTQLDTFQRKTRNRGSSTVALLHVGRTPARRMRAMDE